MNETEKKLVSSLHNATADMVEPFVENVSPEEFQVSEKSLNKIRNEVLNNMAEEKLAKSNKTAKIVALVACATLITGGVITVVKVNQNKNVAEPTVQQATVVTTVKVEPTAEPTVAPTVETTAGDTVKEKYIEKTAKSADDVKSDIVKKLCSGYTDKGYRYVEKDVDSGNVIDGAWLSYMDSKTNTMALVYKFDTLEHAEEYFAERKKEYENDKCELHTSETDDYIEIKKEEDDFTAFIRLYKADNTYEYYVNVDLTKAK